MDEPCVYKKHKENTVVFLVLYVDDILLIGNDIGVLSTVKVWLASTFFFFFFGIWLIKRKAKRH